MKNKGALLLCAAALLPACGGGGGSGGGAPPGGSGASPSTTVATPAGAQRSIIPLDVILFDAESNPVSITVEFSANGGSGWSPATPGSGNGPTTGLTSSPVGTPHTFLWDSVRDNVAAGTVAFGGSITDMGTSNGQVRIRVTPSDGTTGPPASTGNFTVDNTYHRTSGVASATFPHTFSAMGASETALGDLVADALRARYGTQLAFQNGWGIRVPLPSGGVLPANLGLRRPSGGYVTGPPWDLVVGDFHLMLPFGNRVVTRTVTGAQLWAILEHGVSTYPAAQGGFPQISGFSFTFKASNPVGSRVQSVIRSGGSAIPADATSYTFATNDFLNAGGDGYAMLNDGQGTAKEILAQAVADHVRTVGTVTPSIAGRITIDP